MKYSNGSMLTRSDITILMQQVDVTKAYDLLAMFKEAGKERIDIRTILDEAAPKIKDYSVLVARLPFIFTASPRKAANGGKDSNGTGED